MRRVSLLIVILLAAISAQAQERPIKVSVDPRVELLATALMQSDWPDGRRGYLSPYARDMQQNSFGVRKHPFITEINARNGKLTLSELIALALSSADPANPGAQPTGAQSLGAAFSKFA